MPAQLPGGHRIHRGPGYKIFGPAGAKIFSRLFCLFFMGPMGHRLGHMPLAWPCLAWPVACGLWPGRGHRPGQARGLWPGLWPMGPTGPMKKSQKSAENFGPGGPKNIITRPPVDPMGPWELCGHALLDEEWPETSQQARQSTKQLPKRPDFSKSAAQKNTQKFCENVGPLVGSLGVPLALGSSGGNLC